jgi:hypothetical protein
MTDKEAMAMALDALTYKKWFCLGMGKPNDPRLEAAITALKERLADPMREVQRLGQEIEQEPVSQYYDTQLSEQERKVIAARGLEPLVINRIVPPVQRTEQERDEILQAITDPENQPSQFGTVTLEYHEEKIKQWENLFDRMHANFERASDKAIAQRTEQNFCSRCGKRTPDLITIHTCTPPKENT